MDSLEAVATASPGTLSIRHRNPTRELERAKQQAPKIGKTEGVPSFPGMHVSI